MAITEFNCCLNMKICQKDKKKSKCIPISGVKSFHKWTSWKDCFIQFLASTLLIYDLSFLILLFCSKPIEPDRLFDCLPKSLRPSSGGEENINNSKHENQAKSLEAAVYKPPALIPPRVLPLLHDLAQQLVQAGHQQQCFKIYRLEQAKHDQTPLTWLTPLLFGNFQPGFGFKICWCAIHDIGVRNQNQTYN